MGGTGNCSGDPLVLAGGTILTMNADREVIADGAVCITGDRLRFVGPRAELPAAFTDAEAIDLTGRLVMPGLVNTHTHAPMSLFRGLADDLPLADWLGKHIFPAEAKFINPESVRLGTRLSLVEMLLSGTTTYADGYFHEDAVLLAAQELGMRGVFAQGVIDFPAPGVPDPERNVAAARRHLEQFASDGPQAPAVFAHSPYTCSAGTLVRAKALSREFGVLFFIHVAETEEEVSSTRENHDGLTPIRYLDSLELLGERTVLVHAIHVDEEEQDLIAARGAAVSICTESSMKLASGVAPLPGYLHRGVPAGLGTDGCASNNDLDMFLEMSQTARLHKLCTGDPSVLSARQVVELATRGGARALGLAHEIGSLEPGKLADVIAVRIDRPHAAPLYNPYSQLAYSASGADVDLVIVGGKVLVKERRLTNCDVAEVCRAANEIAVDIARLG